MSKFSIFILNVCLIANASAQWLDPNWLGEISDAMKNLGIGFHSIVDFILYNKENPYGKTFTTETIKTVNFDINVPSKFLIHGWINDRNSDMPKELHHQYSLLGKFNVVVVDWSGFSKNMLYPVPANGTTYVGGSIAYLLSQLYENSTRENSTKGNLTIINVHMLGFSLGAHVASFAGRKLKERGYIVERITGLDPALPLIFDGLSSNDAAFVDVIHTTAGTLGQRDPIGHADFYPNGGFAPQPHCMNYLLTIMQCSHSASWKYFSLTINNPKAFEARRCSSIQDIPRSCHGPHVSMGEYLPSNSSGVFYATIDIEASEESTESNA